MEFAASSLGLVLVQGSNSTGLGFQGFRVEDLGIEGLGFAVPCGSQSGRHNLTHMPRLVNINPN